MIEPLLEKMKINRDPITEEVFETMKEYIATNKWKIGDKIPSESDLAEIFGVNRLTVRIAMQKLKTIGIVETRMGEGTFVSKFNFNKYLDEVAEFTFQTIKEQDVRDFLKLIVVDSARIAIKYAIKEDLYYLEKTAKKCGQLVNDLFNNLRNGRFDKVTFIEMVKADVNFHYEICKMSHNTLYENSFIIARNSVYDFHLERLDNYLSKSISIQNFSFITSIHQNLFSSIQDKNFEMFKKLYLEMLDCDHQSFN